MKQVGAVLASVAIALAVASIGAGPVHAAPLSPELEASYKTALSYWGDADGPPQCASVDRQIVPATDIGGYRGLATQPRPTAKGLDCILRVASGLPPCESNDVLLHEVGHLFGHGHSDDPSNPMHASRLSPCKTERLLRDARRTVAHIGRKLDRMRTRCRTLHHRRRACWEAVRPWRREWRVEVRYMRYLEGRLLTTVV